MKVLFSTYPVAFDPPGGGERQLMAYYRHLPSHGVEPSLFNLWEPRFREHALLHFFSVMPGSIYFCDDVRRRGLPIVISPNLWVTPQTKFDYPHEDIVRLLPYANRIVVNSNSEGDQLCLTYDLPRERFVTVYNGVEQEFCMDADPSLFTTKYRIEAPFLLNVANIEPRKNQLEFIRAIKRYRELNLVIVGHVRDVEYASQCFQEGGSRVTHIGPLPYNSPILRSAFAACELFVMPSLLETPSIAALEAAAVGARILITEVGCTREYFEDLATYVDPRSNAAMEQGVRAALAMPKSETLRNRVRAKFTWPKVTEDLANCYRDLAR